jgi:RNA 3'-terminal phosphate cyclase (ATP)
MIEIDGGQESGSGTIVRDAVSLSVLAGKDLHIKNIRAKRDKPGLRPQHLKAIEASAQICQGRVEGAKVGSKEIKFRPGRVIKGGELNWDIETAGSAVMLALTVIPLALFAEKPSRYRITGGLFQDYAPSAYHLKHVLLPILRAMRAGLDLKIIQPGYVPQGKGQIQGTGVGSSLLLAHLLMKMKNMAGPLQIQYPGAWDHVINNRGRIGGIVFKNKVVKNRIPNKHIEKLKQEVKVSQEQT